MHALALNLIRTELEDRLLADLGANSTLHPQGWCQTVAYLIAMTSQKHFKMFIGQER